MSHACSTGSSHPASDEVTANVNQLPSGFLSVLRRSAKEYETLQHSLGVGAGLEDMQKLPLRTSLYLSDEGMDISDLAWQLGLIIGGEAGMCVICSECQKQLGAPTQEEMLAVYPPAPAQPAKRNSWVAASANSEEMALFMEAALKAGGAILDDDDGDDDGVTYDGTDEWTPRVNSWSAASTSSSPEYTDDLGVVEEAL